MCAECPIESDCADERPPSRSDRSQARASPHALQATHPSLLSRVRDPADAAAWREFEALYRELLVRFCRRRGLQLADAEDVVQVVLTNLSKSLPGFVYDAQRGRFRDYLYRCTRNAISQWASRPRLDAATLDSRVADHPSPVDSPGGGGMGGAGTGEVTEWEQEWVAHHYRLAMQAVRRTFEPRSIEVFERSIGGATVAELAAAFAMSEQAVHKVRQRIKARMEELIAEQIRAEDAVSG
jgi:RNA polymerase sigma factor (sigma-70 family)